MLNLRFFSKLLASKLCIIIGLSSLFFVVKVAKADYVPPQDQEAPSDYSKSVAAGHRSSCWSEDNASITLLAPQTHVGQTVSTRPSFTWFISEAEKVKLEFNLFEYDREGKPSKLVKSLVPASQTSKIQTISLQEDKEELKVDHKYMWQVTVNCPNSSQNVIARADLKVVETVIYSDPVSQKSLTNSVDTYAQSSLWYDALEMALVEKTNGADTGITELLEQLAGVEAISSVEGKTFSDRLNQIIETELQTKAN